MLFFHIYFKNSELNNVNPQSLSGALFPTTFLEIALYLRSQDGSFREVQLYFFALPSTTRANF